MLKRSHDILSPCLNSRLVLNSSERSFPISTMDFVSTKVILHNRIKLVGIPNSDMASKTLHV